LIQLQGNGEELKEEAVYVDFLNNRSEKLVQALAEKK
jgi:hypothetical protein